MLASVRRRYPALMNERAFVLLIALALAVVPARADAGLVSALGKLGKLGKVAKAAKAAKLAKAAKVGQAAAGVTAVVAAERAAPIFASLGDDVARSATYLARGADGELLRVTKAAGAESVSAEALGTGLRAAGERPSVFLDVSAADAAPALAAEHPNAALALVDGEKRLSLLRKEGGDLAVETAQGLVDLEDYLEGSDEGFVDEYAGPIGVGVIVVAVAIWWRTRRRAAATA